MRYIKTICCVVMLCSSLVAFAQDAQEIICEAYMTPAFGKDAGVKKTRIAAAFCVQPTKALADDIKKEYDKWAALKEKEPEYAYSKMEQHKKKYGLNKQRTSGIFKQRAIPGSFLVVIDTYENCWVIEIVPGKTKYETLAPINESVAVEVKGKTPPPPPPPPFDADDGTQIFPIKLALDADLLRNDSRLIVKCIALDCQTEDTVDYFMSMVYEGDKYHVLQDKRKDYAFFLNDSLSKVYRSTFEDLSWNDEIGRMEIDTTCTFVKPDVKKSYRCLIKYNIEDYHDTYSEGEELGGCLSIRPFKFLDFSSSVPEMELREDFKEEEEMTSKEIERDLDLKFVTGKSILREDSLNDILASALIDELKSYGVRLVNPKIIGAASPEGSNATNQSLASQRADVARRMILPHLVKGISISKDIKVYTWSDVADRLEQNGMKIQADAVRAKIQEIGADQDLPLDRAIYALSCYNDTIKPLLQTFQIMKCSYNYVKEHVFTPEQVVEEFNKYKEEYRTGKKQFTSSDYYNLFANITDSIDRDTLINMAYRYLTRPGNPYIFDKLTPYVFDLKQKMNQRLGISDTTMLAELIDWNTPNITFDGGRTNKIIDGQAVAINRAEHLVTQAISYFYHQKFAKSQAYLDWVKNKGGYVQGMEKLEHFMNLKTYGPLESLGMLNPEQQRKLDAAKDHIMGNSVENRAILYTEMNFGTYAEAEKYIDMLDDANPKKWYLKGLIWAKRTNNKLLEDVQPDLSKYDDDQAESDDLELNKIPHYLAYFHHCFKLRPEYRKFYFNDGQINEKQRERYPYIRTQVPAYDKLFKLLQKRDAENREKHMEDEEMNDEETETVETPVAPKTPAEVAATGNN